MSLLTEAVSFTIRAESRREKLRVPVGWSLPVSRQKGYVNNLVEGEPFAWEVW